VQDPFLRTVRATIERRRLLRRRDSVLVAVSGGPDSVALLASLASLGDGRWRIGVAHVNHRLRGRDSERDERFVAELARRFGLELHVLDGRIAPGGNLEERAREARYALLLHEAKLRGYRRIATGHTLDDQAETFLLRLLRGAGPRGLRAIAPERTDGVVRPLIDVTRAEGREFLARVGLRFRRDRTNADPRFTRNRVRRRLLPMLEREFNPNARATLARAAAILAEEDDLLERTARRKMARLVRTGRIEADGLGRLVPAIARRIVRAWLEGAPAASVPTSEQVETVIALARREEAGAVALGGGEVRKSGGWLRWRPASVAATVVPRPARLPVPGERAFGPYRIRARAGRSPRRPSDAWRAVFDADGIRGRLRVRAPRAGDRIRPLGLGGTKKLQDVFVDARLDREHRSAHPIVETGGEIIWVPGIVRGEAAPVTPRTRRVVVLECSRGG
jgi:tRNA(Ile)-lysidine synthase